MMWLFSMVTGCLSGGASLPEQVPIQVQLVVHVDPLIRGTSEACANPDLERCGPLQGDSFVRRTNNLAWLVEDWLQGQRTMDIQVGPDVALAWVQESTVLGDIANDVGMEAATDVADQGWMLLNRAMSSGSATLGVHGHDQVQDADGRWGEVSGPDPDEPCMGTEDGPLTEWILAEHVEAVAELADSLDVPLLSLSSHVPRTMANKILAAADPDALDPSTARTFSERFRPISLGNAMSSCFSLVADHPPFETYKASLAGPLLAGDGPMVVPAVRVVGSMAPHFGMERDGSLPAAQRRLIQLLVNWRYAALDQPSERPWTFTFHTHLFDLQEGTPDVFSSSDRQLNPAKGHSYRRELSEIGRVLDRLTAQAEWNGVLGRDGQVVEWRTVDAFQVENSEFDVGGTDFSGPSLGGAGPYLNLLAKQLKNSHFLCEAHIGHAKLYGFQRCKSGWGWGMPGYGCSDGQAPDWVGLLIPDLDGCVDIPPRGLLVGPVDGDILLAPELCNDGIWVPREGLVVSTSQDASLPSLCDAG